MSTALVMVSGWTAPGVEWRLSPIRSLARDRAWFTYYHHGRLPVGPIEESAARLAELVDRCRHEHIFLVGHSMGGLVVERAAMLVPVTGVVAIGTPFGGAPLASVFHHLHRSVYDMRAGSELLRTLAGATAVARPPILAVGCKYDILVNGGRARPVRPHTYHLAPTTHISAIYHRPTAERIIDWCDQCCTGDPCTCRNGIGCVRVPYDRW